MISISLSGHKKNGIVKGRKLYLHYLLIFVLLLYNNVKLYMLINYMSNERFFNASFLK